MKGTSNLMVGLTLVVVVSLAMVLGLVLVLLAELYCSLLIRRRPQPPLTTTIAATTTTTATISGQPQSQAASPPPPPSLSNFYAQGVLTAPRSFLYPAVSGNDIEKHHPQPPENQESGKPRHQDHDACEDHLVYISNPIYDNEIGRVNTPYETPDTSPSRLETEDSSGDDERNEISSSSPICSSSKIVITPPLTPMKNLPSEACSVPMKDARSLRTSGSDSNSNNGVSSSSSGTPCTSPSW